MTTELLINAIIAGLLLGGLYAALTVGVSLSFGMLDIVNIAHPAFIILGAYIAYILNFSFGLDPLIASIIALPAFWALGALVYQVYHVSFEKRGQDPMRGLAFFFGIMIIVEVLLIIVFGVDYRYVEAPYLRTVWNIGFVALPLRMLVPFAVAAVLITGLIIYLSRTFTERQVGAMHHGAGDDRGLTTADRIIALSGAFPDPWLGLQSPAFLRSTVRADEAVGPSLAGKMLGASVIVVEIGHESLDRGRLVMLPAGREEGFSRHPQIPTRRRQRVDRYL